MKTITVSRQQVIAARALIQLSGGEEQVDPVIVRIAHAEKPSTAKPAGRAS
ncbi:MAG: hypothetical protein QOK11_2728 [Pseudonocardiales bacterium]|nr:hypothetical protein [Pseudonocardiales bacterium]